MKDEDLQGLSFEDALLKLENIVRELESGRIKLDDAVTAYEQAVKLKQFCEQKLQAAQLKIEKIEIAPAPASTSVGKCMKLYMRENAISTASTIAGIPILLSISISVTAAVMPFNVCPEGNDESNGIFTIRLTVSSI